MHSVVALTSAVAVVAVGFGLGLEGLRRWLFPDARASGRCSVIAGLLAPGAAFIVTVLWPSLGTLGGIGALALAGVVIAVVMFFAWLTPRDEAGEPS